MFSPEGTFISASAAPHCRGPARPNENFSKAVVLLGEAIRESETLPTNSLTDVYFSLLWSTPGYAALVIDGLAMLFKRTVFSGT